MLRKLLVAALTVAAVVALTVIAAGALCSAEAARLARNRIVHHEAEPERELLLGVQTLDFAIDRDIVRIPAQLGKFARLRLRVLDADVFFSELRVLYTEGEPDILVLDSEVRQGARTAWLPLKGDRFIKEVQMIYRNRPGFKGRARVEVFGDYAQGWLAADGEGRQHNAGWVLIGARSAPLRAGYENEVVPVAANTGGLKRLRVMVKERPVSLRELRVVYDEGEHESLPVNGRIDAGGVLGPLDLKGADKAIRGVQLIHRSRFPAKPAAGSGTAVVEVWGQY